MTITRSQLMRGIGSFQHGGQVDPVGIGEWLARGDPTMYRLPMWRYDRRMNYAYSPRPGGELNIRIPPSGDAYVGRENLPGRAHRTGYALARARVKKLLEDEGYDTGQFVIERDRDGGIKVRGTPTNYGLIHSWWGENNPGYTPEGVESPFWERLSRMANDAYLEGMESEWDKQYAEDNLYFLEQMGKAGDALDKYILPVTGKAKAAAQMAQGIAALPGQTIEGVDALKNWLMVNATNRAMDAKDTYDYLKDWVEEFSKSDVKGSKSTTRAKKAERFAGR